MRNFLRQYNQEVIAVLLIAGFWGSIWGYHAYQAHQANAAIQAATVEPGSTTFNK